MRHQLPPPGGAGYLVPLFKDIAVRAQVCTDDATYDTGAGGSRVTHVGGQAVYGASQEVRRKLVTLAADLFDWPEDRITFSNHQLHAPGHEPVNLADLVSPGPPVPWPKPPGHSQFRQ